MSDVKWVKVEGFPGYLVNTLGEVHSIHKGNLQRVWGRFNTKNYYQIVLYKRVGTKRETHQKYVHTIVAEAFICKKPGPKWQVNHIDKDRTNNRLENLEWTEEIQNYRHRDGKPYTSIKSLQNPPN